MPALAVGGVDLGPERGQKHGPAVASILLPLLLPEGWIIDKLGRTLAALTLFAAAYLAEVIRGGLQGVDPGQEEAARALGLPFWRTVWHIILPQAIQKVIPPLTNTVIVMVKNTSLVIIVGVYDMLGAGRAAASDPAWPAPFAETYLFIAVIYFVICFGISLYARWLERSVKQRRFFLGNYGPSAMVIIELGPEPILRKIELLTRRVDFALAPPFS